MLYFQNKQYIMWFILALAYIIVQFHRISFAVIVDYVILDFNIEKASIAGLLGGMYGITYLVMQVPSGLLADSWGPQKTVSTGMLVAGIGTIVFALTNSLLLAFLGRLFLGIGVSVVLVPTMKFQSNWFNPFQFATFAGLIVLVGNIGKLLGTRPLAYVLTHFDWRSTFILIGLFTLVISGLTRLIVKDSPYDNNNYNIRRSDTCDVKESVSICNNLLKSVKDYNTWFLLIVGFGMAGPLLAFLGTWSINYLMQIYELPRIEASNYILVMTIGIGFGAVITGYLSDCFGVRKKPLIILLVLNIVSMMVVIIWNGGKPPLEFLYIAFFVMGVSISGIALVLSLAKEFSGSEYSGTNIGIVNMGPFAGMAIFQLLQGWILDLRWTGSVDELGNKIYPLEAFNLIFLVNLLVFFISLYFAFKLQETKLTRA